MSEPGPTTPLAKRWPQVGPGRLVAELVPPPRFRHTRFGTYHPDPTHPSQRDALERLEAYAASLHGSRRRRWWPGGRGGGVGRGRYVDGGFGVGKTHLLASLWYAAPPPSAYATFAEFTRLVGALGFAATVEALRGFQLVCIDEFELDDPGDTVLMSTLLVRLSDAGVALAATSNTLPGALGEGRFAAEDFRREIQGLADRFETVTVDGEDYRHRGLPPAPQPVSDGAVHGWGSRLGAAVDGFEDLLAQLAQVHPSRYGALLDGVPAVGWTGVHPVEDQAVALRLVSLADRLYDRELPLLVSGMPVDRLFPPELLAGGYRKKYLRATSRLTALAREAGSTADRQEEPTLRGCQDETGG